jgi:2-C-methyl-D-erythritol 4-phosphate cytidylyltransferase/2-C-methyl-D-erythritol 2,4-cyclodiphosphate synthase
MYDSRQVIAVLMAAGSGSRVGAGTPKQFLNIGGEPMVCRAARAFEDCAFVDDVYAVVPEADMDRANGLLAAFGKYRGACAGAEVRQESVRRGLRFVAGSPRAEGSRAIVLIHDAARPFVTQETIVRVLAGAAASGAAVACVPATDTVYEASGVPACGRPLLLADAPDRDLLWSVQTPQGFDLAMILDAHDAAAADGFEATDDGAVAFRYGGADVLIAMGDYANRKITVPGDLPAADGAGGAGDRVGTGFDVHAFAAPEASRVLVLGGVEIPYERGLDGHSDADVLTHALMDAMLGALALGDIGKLFPDTDERYRGISSMKLLAEVRARVEAEGYIVYNADTTIVAERPRMAEHADAIRDSLAAALGVPRDRIGVKATTTEGLGFTGREEGIGAQAIVRLVEKEDR